jgi:hypothetical protein
MRDGAPVDYSREQCISATVRQAAAGLAATVLFDNEAHAVVTLVEDEISITVTDAARRQYPKLIVYCGIAVMYVCQHYLLLPSVQIHVQAGHAAGARFAKVFGFEPIAEEAGAVHMRRRFER